jgi:transcription initiation factor TFIIIB Brf1 subunit/transcription initiation factor TFIIB
MRTRPLLHKELNLKPPVDDSFKYVPNIAATINVNQSTEQLVKYLKKEMKKKPL